MALVHASSGDVFCSGVISRGLVLTAAHCIDGDEPWKVARFSNTSGSYGEGASYRIVAIDEPNDFAVLQAREYVLEGGMPLAVDPPIHGQQVVVIGHPRGLEYTITEGIISHPRRQYGGKTWMQVSAPVTYGNSGGPVFTRHGEVIGIVSFMHSRERHLAGVVHIDVITNVIQKITQKEN